MKPRSKNQFTRLQPTRNSSSARPRPTTRRAASGSQSISDKINTPEPGTSPDLENEIPADQLANFTNEVTSLVSQRVITKPEISTLIQSHLPNYSDLVTELNKTREIHDEHLLLTKPLTSTAQSIQEDTAVSKTRKNEILNLAIKAVEKNLQLKHRLKNLHERLNYLSSAIPTFLTNHAIYSGNHYKHLEATTENLKTILRTF